MSFVLSCLELSIAIFLVYISFQIKDKVVSQIALLFSIGILILNVFFAPLLMKLIVASILFFAWPIVTDRLSIFFYRQLNDRQSNK